MTATRSRQSLAIMEYLDEIVPEPPLLPKDALGRARVREIACVDRLRHPSGEQSAGRCNICKREFDVRRRARRSNWQRHWIAVGFDALETMLSLSKSTGAYLPRRHTDASPTSA